MTFAGTPRQPNYPGTSHFGFPWKVVVIEEIDVTGIAMCRDDKGGRHRIQVQHRRAKGALPRQGELWLIDHSLGIWTFACILEDRRPEVAGDCEGNGALWNLLNALEDMGLILNHAELGEHIHTPHDHAE